MKLTTRAILAFSTRTIVALILLALAISISLVLVRTRTEPALADERIQPPPVMVIEARLAPVRRQWQGFGTAAARHAANVPAQVRGVIVELPADIVAGARVRRGQMLMRLDGTDFEDEIDVTEQRIEDIRAQIAQVEVEFRAWTQRLELAQEDIKIAEADFERITRARDEGSATQREVDQIRTVLLNAEHNAVQVREQLERLEPRIAQLEAMMAQQRAALRIAQRNLDRCTIVSPIDGVLHTVDVEVGESVGIDQRVARIVSLERIEIPIRLPASARSFIRLGDDVDVQSAGAARQTWVAQVTRIAPEDDAATRSMTVYVEIEQDPDALDRLAPGTFVQAIVRAQSPDLRWIVPRRAVQADRVRLIRNGTVISRRIDIDYPVRARFPQFGIDDQQWLVLRDEPPADEYVVVDGARVLAEGSRVTPVLAEVPAEQNGLATIEHETEGATP